MLLFLFIFRLCLLVRQPDAICKAIWSGNHIFFEYAEWLLVCIFLLRYVLRNLCTEVPEEATRQGKVPGPGE